MPKRRNPYDDVSCHQLKTHIGQREMASTSDSNMHSVYERTLKLLSDGSRHQAMPHDAGNGLAVRATIGGAFPYTLPPPDQLRLDSSGQLVHAAAAAVVAAEEMDDGHMAVRDDENNSFACSNRNVDTKKGLKNNLFRDSGERCYGCRCLLGGRAAGSAVPVARCCWCDKSLCAACVQHCSLCTQTFCHVCCSANYDDQFERTFCVQCAQCG